MAAVAGRRSPAVVVGTGRVPVVGSTVEEAAAGSIPVVVGVVGSIEAAAVVSNPLVGVSWEL